MAPISRTVGLLDVREDAVELVEAVVADDELAAALGTVLQEHPGPELVGEVLLELADEVKALVESRQLEMGHARALLGLAVTRQQVEVAMLVARKGLSVRETEALVRRLSTRKEDIEDREPVRPDPNITRLEQNLTDKLGAKVQVQHGAKGRGKLVIAYNSLDELDGILAHIQ